MTPVLSGTGTTRCSGYYGSIEAQRRVFGLYGWNSVLLELKLLELVAGVRFKHAAMCRVYNIP